MFTAPMIKLFAVVMEKDSKAVTETILQEGVMEFINVSELKSVQGGSKVSAGQEEFSKISDLRKRVEGFLHSAGIRVSVPTESDLSHQVEIDISKENERLDKVEAERQRIRQQQQSLQQEALRLEDIKRQVQIYGGSLSGAELPSGRSFLVMQTGKLSAGKLTELEEGLKGLPAINMNLGQEGETVYQLMISVKRDNERINKLLGKVGWSEVELSGEMLSDKKDLMDELTVRLKKIADEQQKLQEKVKELISRDQENLKILWVNLRIKELCYKIETNYQASSRTKIFAGWLPLAKKKALTASIDQATEGRCYMEWQEADSEEIKEDDVPVAFANPKIMSPFELLVSNFGVPKYGTIDPTPFVMPIYFVMFGLMFPDVGQGLVLALLGGVGAWFLKKKEESRNYYQISMLVIWCGVSAMIFGSLFGSYFGVTLFEPLWFNFHSVVSGHEAENGIINNIYDILLITLYFGIGVIGLGLLFNWINLGRAKQWMELVFDKGGLLGGWIYAGGIYIAYYMVDHEYKGLPSGNVIFLLTALPALLLFIKEPYHYLKHYRGKTEEPVNPVTLGMGFLMQWIVELLEIFSGYLSNTLSFMRVAGLGIAHVSLMIAFFTLADMTSGVFAWLILIFGNMLVIALEGLSAGIQALRLNYYEFFTKFFHGTGKLHTPISLKSKL